MMKRFAIGAGILMVLVAMPALLLAQTEGELTYEAVKAEKKAIIARAMKLTESEQEVFWPLYDQYQAQLEGLNTKIGAVIEDFAENYPQMTDAKAKELLDQSVALDQEALTLKVQYIAKFSEVLPAKRVARYFQIENKIDAIIDARLATLIPLVQ